MSEVCCNFSSTCATILPIIYRLFKVRMYFHLFFGHIEVELALDSNRYLDMFKIKLKERIRNTENFLAIYLFIYCVKHNVICAVLQELMRLEVLMKMVLRYILVGLDERNSNILPFFAYYNIVLPIFLYKDNILYKIYEANDNILFLKLL